jgi:hypothetical protein
MPPSADELAAAVRGGLTARRFFRPVPVGPLPPVPASPAVPVMDEFRRVQDRPAPRPRVPVVGHAMWFLRSVVKKLIGPWLERQTAFNDAATDHARTVHAQLALVTARLNAIQTELIPAYHATQARVGECVTDVSRLWEAVRPAGERALGAADGPPLDPPGVVEGLFALTRIGHPPGSVLVLGPGRALALDLAAVGFQVAWCTAHFESAVHPRVETVPAGASNPLPFPDAAFDRVVVSGGADWAEVARVLAPGGTVIGLGSSAPWPAAETAFARRAGHGWELAPAATGDTVLTLWTAPRPS